MGAISGLDDAINKLTGGNNGNPELIWMMKTNRIGAAAAATPVIARYTSLWGYNGNPCGGATPGGTARNPTNSTNGALRQTDASGGRTKYLTGAVVTSRTQGSFFLYDRLADISGLSGTTTTAQNTTSLSVSRYTGTSSVGNEIWVEIYTAVGGSATTIKASYTNQAGTAGQITPLVIFGGTNDSEATRMFRLPLAAGDTGVRSVESVTVTATTGTAGDFGVTIARKHALITMAYDGTWGVLDLLTGKPGPVAIASGACLALIGVFRAATVSEVTLGCQFIEA
jgi:hypothetical protein